MMNNKKVIANILLILSLSLNTACTVTGVTYEASSYNVREAEKTLDNNLAVGDFSRKQNSLVQDPWIFREASKVASPIGEGHHDYIADAIKTELMLARRYDANSDLVLTGEMFQHLVDAGMSEGVGSVGMRFMLDSAGSIIYDENKFIEHKWDSAFVGVTAANKAYRGHLEMTSKLINNLFSDTNFINAVNNKGKE